MSRKAETTNQTLSINLNQARWVYRVLGMLIAVVGPDSLLGLILVQTRQEIRSLVEAAVQEKPQNPDTWFLNN